MPTNPPPCYRCGMRPSMLPIAYCAECYQLTGARLLTAVEVAAELGLDRTRIHQLSRQHGIGLPAGPRNTRLYTPAMAETLRTIRRPGGRPVTTNRYTLLRSTPAGETYAAIISRDGRLIGITDALDYDDVEDILADRDSLSGWDYNEPTEGQIEMWERDGWEVGPRFVERD